MRRYDAQKYYIPELAEVKAISHEYENYDSVQAIGIDNAAYDFVAVSGYVLVLYKEGENGREALIGSWVN